MDIRMKRRVLIVILTFLLVSLLLIACPNIVIDKANKATSNIDEAASSKVEKPKIEIQYAQWSVPSTGNLEERLNLFNNTNKDNIHISKLNIPLERYMETLNMLNASGDGPDVYEIMKEWLNIYIIKEWVSDLSGKVGKDFYQYYPDWVSDTVIKTGDRTPNALYSMPSTQITYRLIYNKDLFKEAGLDPESPPKTLAQLQSYAKQISNAEKGRRKYGMAMPMGEEWVDFVQPMEALSCYSGVHFYDFKNGKYDLTVYQPWLSAFRTLNENGGLFPGMDTMKSNLAMAQFTEGNIGMMLASSWEISLLLKEYTAKCEWAVALPPTIDDSGVPKGKIKIDSAGWNVIKAHTEHPEEALKVWKYLYSHDYLDYLFINDCAIPIMNKYRTYSGSSILKSNFNGFLPGVNDSVYPVTPLTMEEWARKKIYSSVILNNPKGQPLLEETNRLNSLLNVSVSQKYIDYNEYYLPNFDPNDPMKN